MSEFSKISRKGFTLFELLVVIAILGLLMSLGLVSYSNAQRKARDSRAKADIKKVSDTFEQYFAVNETYADCATMVTGVWLGSWPPTDSRGRLSTDGNYVYHFTCSIDSYCVCADLEQGAGGNAGDSSCNWSANGGYFCMISQQ